MADAPDTNTSNPAATEKRIRHSLYLLYGYALLGVALALLLRIYLTRYLGTQFPFTTVFVVVIIVAWSGGFWPAMFAAVVGYLGAEYFIVPPLYSVLPHTSIEILGAGFFFLVSMTSALFGEAQRRAQARAEAILKEARQQETLARESEAFKSAILETALDAIILMDGAGCIVEFNPAAERIFGIARSKALGQNMAELLIPPAQRERHRKGLAHYLATGEGVMIGRRLELMALRATGIEFPVEVALARIPGDGPPLFSGYIHDITGRKKIETRQRFLAEASDLLASSLDYQTTLQSVAQLAVPHLADWCVVDMAGENGSIERVAVAHADPEKITFAHQLYERYPLDPDATMGVPQVIRTGKSEIIADIPDELMRATLQDDELYRIMKELSFKSCLCVALIARGRNLGAITFVGAESGHRFGPDDLELAEELARRAAIAVDNALLFQAERERSQQLTLAIQEVHHRVKNNLQAVSALLEMQISPDTTLLPIEAVEDSLSQIKTIALVHDMLSRDRPIGTVNVAQVLSNVAELLSTGMRRGEHSAPIRVTAEEVWLSTKSATSLALAVNELLTNAAKHNTNLGRKEDTEHEPIEVFLQHQGEDICVAVQDSGPGFPQDFDPIEDANIGLQLVLTLVQHDLHGTISFTNRSDPAQPGAVRGGRVEITFSKQSLLE